MSDEPIGPDPADLSPADAQVLLLAEVKGLRRDMQEATKAVAAESVGRAATAATARSNRRLARVVVVAAVLIGGAFAKDYVDNGRITCESRQTSRADARAGLVSIAGELSKDDHLTPRELDARLNNARRIALAAYPPLECR